MSRSKCYFLLTYSVARSTGEDVKVFLYTYSATALAR